MPDSSVRSTAAADRDANPLRIAIVVKNGGFLRYIQTQVESLCERGHAIHFAVQDFPVKDEDGLLAELCARYPTVTVGQAAARRDAWAGFADSLRGVLDYCRYLHPDYHGAIGLRERANKDASPLALRIRWVVRRLRINRSARAVAFLLQLLRSLYSAIPPDPGIVTYIRQLDLDLLLTTGLVWPRSGQADHIVACRSRGIPTGYLVNSWDNLTNKGDVKAIPDETYVWNEAQKREAVRLHGMRPKAVQVTGAPLFDRWFDRKPDLSREAFCARVGLPNSGSFVLYIGSSPRIAPGDSEPAFFRKWLAALRADKQSDLASINVLVRPHPFNAEAWRDFTSNDAGVAVYPRHGRWIVKEEDRSDYFHALRYCAAAVGINTSAMVEAAIVGARTFTIEAGEFATMQSGTLHFRYLMSLGIVEGHESLRKHLRVLAEAIRADPGAGRGPVPGVIPFVRPAGISSSSTMNAVSAIERQGHAGARRRPDLSLLWRPVLVAMRLGHACVRAVADRLRPAKSTGALPAPTRLRRAREYYARKLFPGLQVMSANALPEESHLLKTYLSEHLSRKEIERFAKAEAHMAAARQGNLPIFIGPWLSEVGFEVLYWIPFLRWYRKRFLIDKARIVIISRGGTNLWYGGVAGRYVDLLDLFTPVEFRAANLERIRKQGGKQKQHRPTEMELDIYKKVADRLGIKEYNVFHPSIMYNLFARYWKNVGSPAFLDNCTRFDAILVKPELLSWFPPLPKRFVAVKFYFRESFPDTAENRALVAKVIEALARDIDVVLISSDTTLDDHSDFTSRTAARVHHIDPMRYPSQNLAIQTAILAKSEAFVGTYGGLSYVANLLGKTAFCFESDHRFNRPVHTEVAMRKLRSFGGNLYVLDARDLTLFERMFGGTLEAGHMGQGVPAQAPAPSWPEEARRRRELGG